MPIYSRHSIPIPSLGLPTWLFGPPDAAVSDNIAFVDTTRPETHSLTFAEYKLWSRRLAAGLQRSGLKPGDRVLVFSGNNIYFPVLFMGILMAGGIFTGANPSFVARELAYQLSDSGAKFLLAADSRLELALEAIQQSHMSKEHVFVFDDEKSSNSFLGVRNWKDLLVTISEGERFRWWEPENPKESTCCLNYSSGTTGVPKGVEITHYNYVANNSQVIYNANLHPDAEDITDRSKWLCFLPMYHAMGQTNFVTIAPRRGIPVYIMPKFDFIQVLENIQRFKITQLDLVPPIVVQFVKHPKTKEYDLSSVINIASGAAPLGADVGKEFEALWPKGQVNMKQGWGMTEATCTLLGWDPRELSHSSSVGELMANCSAKIMSEDPATELLNRGQRGEVWVRGPNIMKGYWRKPAATAEMLTVDGWMKTGDIGYVDEHGKFFIVDRKKELIKVKGNQVAPAELESVLLDHQSVADAAVVGVVIRGEERPRAYIVSKAGIKEEAAGKELQTWMEKRVSRHKWLTGGVVFVDVIPKNPSGKILRKILRERAKTEVGDKDIRSSRL